MNAQPSSRFLKFLLPALGVFIVGLNWLSTTVSPGNLMLEVQPIFQVNWLETKWLYAILLAFTLFCPAVFGLLPQLKFYKEWPRFFKANLPVAAVFIAWDAWFAKIGVWGFSEKYTSGLRFWGLPWEEWAFFVIVPAACVFIFDALGKMPPTPKRIQATLKAENYLTLSLATFFLATAIFKWQNSYTATTALGCAFLLAWHFLFGNGGWRGRFYVSYLISCFFFLFVNGVLTGGFTQSPVVVYNPEEYFGLRVGTIPADDFAYSFLMLFANVWLFEEAFD